MMLSCLTCVLKVGTAVQVLENSEAESSRLGIGGGLVRLDRLLPSLDILTTVTLCLKQVNLIYHSIVWTPDSGER